MNVPRTGCVTARCLCVCVLLRRGRRGRVNWSSGSEREPLESSRGFAEGVRQGSTRWESPNQAGGELSMGWITPSVCGGVGEFLVPTNTHRYPHRRPPTRMRSFQYQEQSLSVSERVHERRCRKAQPPSICLWVLCCACECGGIRNPFSRGGRGGGGGGCVTTTTRGDYGIRCPWAVTPSPSLSSQGHFMRAEWNTLDYFWQL